MYIYIYIQTQALTLHWTKLDCIVYVPFRSVPSPSATFRSVTLHHITWHHIASHYLHTHMCVCVCSFLAEVQESKQCQATVNPRQSFLSCWSRQFSSAIASAASCTVATWAEVPCPILQPIQQLKLWLLWTWFSGCEQKDSKQPISWMAFHFTFHLKQKIPHQTVMPTTQGEK